MPYIERLTITFIKNLTILIFSNRSEKWIIRLVINQKIDNIKSSENRKTK